MKAKLCLLVSAMLILTAFSLGCAKHDNGTSSSASQVIAEISNNEASADNQSKNAETSDEQSSSAETSDEQSSGAETSDEQSSSAETSNEQSSSAETSDEQSSGAETSDERSSGAETSDEQSKDTETSEKPESEASPPALAVTLSKHEIYLHPGEQDEIRYYLTPENAAPPGVIYYISDTSVYTVDPYGVITAVGEGTARLTAEAENGLKDVCTITVTPYPEQSSAPASEPVSQNDNDHDIADRIVNAFLPYTSERVYNNIDRLCDYYVNILSQFNIGESEKGKPIPCITLGKGKKKALITAGIHSREHIAISFTMRCIEEIANAYSTDGVYCGYDVRKLLNKYTLYIVPMCNPDGTDISVAGDSPLVDLGYFDHDSFKLNANGVNLNRNFPYFWEQQYGNTKLIPGNETYPGTHAGSEKETQALIELCAENDFLWMLDMHILGNGIYWRDSGNGEIDGDYLLTTSLAQRCGYRIFDNTTEMVNYSGGLENWFRSAYKRPALCIELLPYSQAYYTNLYSGYNSYFEQAVNWQQTRCTFLEAMSCMK